MRTATAVRVAERRRSAGLLGCCYALRLNGADANAESYAASLERRDDRVNVAVDGTDVKVRGRGSW